MNGIYDKDSLIFNSVLMIPKMNFALFLSCTGLLLSSSYLYYILLRSVIMAVQNFERHPSV